MIRFQTLGTARLTNGGGRELHTVLAQPKRLALLAYLALAGRYVRRDTLLALFWPESTEDRARASLSQALSFLRRALGDGLVITRGQDEVAVDSAELWVDAVELDRLVAAGALEDALALHGGDFLEALHLDDLSEATRWLERERQRLKDLATKAASSIADQALGERDYERARSAAERALALSGPDESAIRRLLSIYERAGEPAGALRVFERVSRELRSEYDYEPSASMAAHLARLRESLTAATVHGIVGGAAPDRLSIPASAVGAPAPGRGSEGGAQDARTLEPSPSVADTLSAGSMSDRRRRRAVLAASAAGMAALATIGVLATARSNDGKEDARHRLVVASFENRTGDSTLDAFGAVAADWITQAIARASLVEVVDEASALAASNRVQQKGVGDVAAANYRRIAAEVRADLVVSGRFHREGDSLVVVAMLSDAETGRLLIAPDPVRTAVSAPAARLEAVRERVLGAIALHLDERLSTLFPPGSTAPPTYEAYRAYIEGVSLYTEGRREAAATQFERAATLDTFFVQPLIWLVWAQGTRSAASRATIERLARHRERLRPLDRYALAHLEALRDRRLGDALVAAREAARLAPGSHWVHNYALVADELGRYHEAVAAYRSVDLHSGWLLRWEPFWTVYLKNLHQAGEFEQELEVARAARRALPQAVVQWEIAEASALLQLGRVKEFERLLASVDPGPRGVSRCNRLVDAALIFEDRGDVTAAHGFAARAVSCFRASGRADFHQARLRMAMALVVLDSLASARTVAERALATVRDSLGPRIVFTTDAAALVGAIAARQGDDARSRELMNQLIQQGAMLAAARIAAARGEAERAVELLRSGNVHISRFQPHPTSFQAAPELNLLRGHPVYEEYIKPRG